MTKYEFVKEVGLKSHTTQRDVKEILNAIEEVIVEHIKDDGGISPFGGMRLYATYKDARRRRNPATGEFVDVAPNYSPKVRFSRNFKDAINEDVD